MKQVGGGIDDERPGQQEENAVASSCDNDVTYRIITPLMGLTVLALVLSLVTISSSHQLDSILSAWRTKLNTKRYPLVETSLINERNRWDCSTERRRRRNLPSHILITSV